MAHGFNKSRKSRLNSQLVAVHGFSKNTIFCYLSHANRLFCCETFRFANKMSILGSLGSRKTAISQNPWTATMFTTMFTTKRQSLLHFCLTMIGNDIEWQSRRNGETPINTALSLHFPSWLIIIDKRDRSTTPLLSRRDQRVPPTLPECNLPSVHPVAVTSAPPSKNCNCTSKNTSPLDEHPNPSKNNNSYELFDYSDFCPCHSAAQQMPCSPCDYPSIPSVPKQPVRQCQKTFVLW